MNHDVKIIKLIENIMSEELEEVAFSSSIASKKNLALITIEVGNRRTYALYKPFQIFGMLIVKYKQNCGAYEVSMSAAESGFGPLLYQAAMSIEGPNFLMADRTMVSDAALNIWRKFYAREDVIKEPLTQKCKYQMVDEENKSLNYKFTLKTPINYSELENNHIEYMNNFNLHGKTKEEFVKTIEELASDFFKEKYND